MTKSSEYINHHRHKLFASPEPSSSESDDSSISSSPLLHFKIDPELPIYHRGPSSYSLMQLINILMDDSLSEEKV